MTQDNLVEAGYDAVHAAMPNSPTLLRIWREHAIGGDFPEEFSHFSFLTLDEIDRISEELSLSPGSSIVDFGCGTGGPGLFLIQRAGARLTGVDLSAAATRLAAERASRLGLTDSARFLKGSFSETGLSAGAADAVVSFDALQYAPDKAAAFQGAARVLRPAGRLAFTAFELEPARARALPILGDDPVADYRALLNGAGFSISVYEETRDWEGRLNRAFSAIVEAKDALTKEMGETTTMAMMSEVSATLEHRPYRRRILCVAAQQA